MAVASPADARNQDVERAELEPLIEQFCFQGHGPTTQTAGINLAALVTQHPLVRNRETWERVIAALELGRMPPRGALQPSETDRRRLQASLSRAVHEFDYGTVDDPGFERMRRLTDEEFDNTVRDLFGVDLNPTKALFMTVWRPSTRSAENSCGIRQG